MEMKHSHRTVKTDAVSVFVRKIILTQNGDNQCVSFTLDEILTHQTG